MPSEVKMPQLGMNQNSAVIVSWLKATGDRVAAGEPIFEVETDKATMEVEAAADGFLSKILSPEGTDVPVGDIIAIIVDSEADVIAPQSDPAKTEPAQEPVPEPAPEKAQKEAKTPDATKIVPPTASAGKVLASPLAKRIASEQGIDLSGLRAGGVAEPIHAADLKRMPAGGNSFLSARVDGTALVALLGRSEGANRSMLFAAFAAGAWEATCQGATLGISVRGSDGTIVQYKDDQASETSLLLVDLCNTRLGTYAPAGGAMTLTTARDGDAFALTLSFSETVLPFAAAVAFLDAIAVRVDDPIRQLL
jgi:pyruvate/2-oxoglutarate dehydrogenase complex dihydrolipoamide acyltransferase (E2) component